MHLQVVQWDKRPIYVPNAKLMSLNVQNNSRMTHRRIKYELKLRRRALFHEPGSFHVTLSVKNRLKTHENTWVID